MTKTKRTPKVPLPDDLDPGYGATAATAPEPNRAQVWLRSFAGTCAAFTAAPLLLAFSAGFGTPATLPFTETPRPLALVALEVGVGAAAVARVTWWAKWKRANR